MRCFLPFLCWKESEQAGKSKIKNCRKEIRLSTEELEELRRKAEEQGLKESQYMRMLITNRPRDYPDLLEALRSLTNEVNHIGININQITKNNNSGLYHESDKNGCTST